MYNLLVIDNNSTELINDINYILDNNSNIKICYISKTIEGCFNKLNSITIDFILLNADYNNSYHKLINYIRKNHLYRYKKSIIIKSSNTNFENEYIYSFNLKIEDISKNLDLLINYRNNEQDLLFIKRKIQQELIKLNYNYSYIGTQYLVDAILEIYKSGYNLEGNLIKEIYPIIAKRYRKKVNTIYCNIKQSTKNMILNCNKQEIKDYFNYEYFIKPKVKEIIITILNKIIN